MNIKKYLAPTLQEAVDRMKEELGDEAIILSTRILAQEESPQNQKSFEVIACVEEEKVAQPEGGPVNKKIDNGEPKNIDVELKRLRERIFKTYHPETNFKKGNEKTAGSEKPAAPGMIKVKLENLKEDLVDKDVQPSLVNKIIEQVSRQSNFIRASDLDNAVISTISSMIPVEPFGVKERRKCRTIAVVGPTGVGKTTCIAKLAVISKILHNLDIGLITLDTYRLGAIDQLKVFSQISNIDLHVAYEAADIPKILTKLKKKDVVFIDTAGRSQNNRKLLDEINKLLAQISVDEVFLALSATSTSKHMIDVASKFSIMDYSGIIVTKIDEAATYGAILNLAARFEVPFKFLTNGQVIPDDIIAADSDFIANMIYTGKFI